MPKYLIGMSLGVTDYEIEADNEDEAVQKADALLIADIKSGVATYYVHEESE